MTFSAKVVAHSSHPACPDLITLEIRYPRFIHSEFMTHREFSRNASSSRAIPVVRTLASILNDPAAPIHWGENHPGMQSHNELTGWRKTAVKFMWYLSCYTNVSYAYIMHKLGAHKQIVNRITEPYSHINVLVTSTNWSNFLNLRDHEDAQPEIRQLAIEIRKALKQSIPDKLKTGQFHLPYVFSYESKKLREDKRHPITAQELSDLEVEMILCQISTARSARLSYYNFDGIRSIRKDLDLYKKLVVSEPLHASPAEHQATPDPEEERTTEWGNLRYWAQHRKMLQNEAILDPTHWKHVYT